MYTRTLSWEIENILKKNSNSKNCTNKFCVCMYKCTSFERGVHRFIKVIFDFSFKCHTFCSLNVTLSHALIVGLRIQGSFA